LEPQPDSRSIADAERKASLALTPRERDVLGLLAMGGTGEDIGRALGIAPRTVRAHTDALRRKLGVSRRRYIAITYRERTGIDPIERPPLGRS
jgi:DNA-binding CsgD family transcriptional regulator